MCLMCIELIKNKMTTREARYALRELMSVSTSATDLNHYQKLGRATDEEMKEIAEEYSSKNVEVAQKKAR